MTLSDRQLKNRFARYSDTQLAAMLVSLDQAPHVQQGKNRGSMKIKNAVEYSNILNEQIRRKYGATNYTQEQYDAVYNANGSLR
jgi:hypothetical protein